MYNKLLYLKVKAEILEKIKNMNDNDRIPSRNDLIKEFECTRTTIERAISELIGEGYLYSKDGSGTYILNKLGKTEKDNESRIDTWGVIIPDIMKDTYPGILRGVEDVANNNNINAIICNTDGDTDKQDNYIYKLIDSNVKGIVIVPVISKDINQLPFKKLYERNIPFVFCNRKVSGIESPQVISNNFYGGYIATKHLLNQGYRRIAYICYSYYTLALERYQGYISALNESGIDVNEDYVIFKENTDLYKAGYDSAKRLLNLNEKPDAMFCFNDTIASGANDAINSENLKVGYDIGLVGYDNTSVCERLSTKLTSVKFKTYEIGFGAGNLLLSMINGDNVDKNKTIIFQPKLVIRESSTRDING